MEEVMFGAKSMYAVVNKSGSIVNVSCQFRGQWHDFPALFDSMDAAYAVKGDIDEYSIVPTLLLPSSV
jgi:hypothetical protein